MKTICRCLAAFALAGSSLAVYPQPFFTPVDILTYAATGEPIFSPAVQRSRVESVDGARIEIPEGMVYVPAGGFMIGAGASAQTVTLPAYFIGKFEVTNAEYKAFLDATGARSYPRYWRDRQYPSGKANHPVLFVSLEDARAYCKWASDQSGRVFAVPTAAQWEKAARGPQGLLYPWGNEIGSSFDRATGKLHSRFNYNAVTAASLLSERGAEPASYVHEKSTYRGKATTIAGIAGYAKEGRVTPFSISDSGNVSGWVNHDTYTGFIYTDVYRRLMDSGGNTSAVGAFPNGVSAYGAHDMAGNVFEWTETMITAGTGAEKGRKVNDVRGGSWYANGSSAKATGIGEGRAASGAYHSVGFRVVINP